MTGLGGGRDARLSSPAFSRNIGPIIDALRGQLGDASGQALEIGSGPGEHVVALARAFPNLAWMPSDPDPAACASIEAWRQSEAPPNLAPPRRLDAAADWAENAADIAPLALALAVNVAHIAPWAAAQGLVRGAGRLLGASGVLALYGPFFEADAPAAPSNLAFDQNLRRRDPAWGVRRLADIDALAKAQGFEGPAITRLPANNLLVAWRAPG